MWVFVGIYIKKEKKKLLTDRKQWGKKEYQSVNSDNLVMTWY